MKTFRNTLILSVIMCTTVFAQMGNHQHGGHLNPDSLQVITVSGTAIVDTTIMMHSQYYIDTDNDNEPDYFLNFGPYWYEPDSSNATRPDNGDNVTIKGGLWENSMMNEPMVVVYEINGEFWRDPFDPFWNHMGNHSHSGGGCGGSGFGWMHDSLTTVNLSGTALVDTTFMHEIYYLDENDDGQPDYILNFGPWWYEPTSGATRPNDGDNITIVGGKLNREFLPMVVVYQINGLFWRDSLSHHMGGGWIHRNMTQSQQFNSSFDIEDKLTFNPGWYQMGGGHGGHGGMMTDSMFCQIFETTPENLPNSSNQNGFAAYEIDIYQDDGMNGNHHNGECGGHMHFNSNANFQLHYTDIEASGFNENSISVKYWDNETSNWIVYQGVAISTTENTVTFSTPDLSNFIILTADNATEIEDEDINITDYVLEQNYPNPFNPTTTISFTIPEKSAIKLEVFNLLGQKVATLIDGTLEIGKHSVELNAQNLSSGIYIYTLKSDRNLNLSRKMILLK